MCIYTIYIKLCYEICGKNTQGIEEERKKILMGAETSSIGNVLSKSDHCKLLRRLLWHSRDALRLRGCRNLAFVQFKIS